MEDIFNGFLFYYNGNSTFLLIIGQINRNISIIFSSFVIIHRKLECEFSKVSKFFRNSSQGEILFSFRGHLLDPHCLTYCKGPRYHFCCGSANFYLKESENFIVLDSNKARIVQSFTLMQSARLK